MEEVLLDQSDAPSFPSLSDSVLESLALHSSSPSPGEDLQEKEIEDKFNTLSIAFKTDKHTLTQRIDLQKRQRDQSERNIDEEINSLRCLINALYILSSTDSKMREHIAQVQQQIDIVQRATLRMTSRSEVFGAVQQEERMNKAFDVMVSHVENLKRVHEKEQAELKETKQLLINNKIFPKKSKDDSSLEFETPKCHKALTRRRASVASIQRTPPILNGEARPRIFSLASTLRPLDRRASLPCVTPLLPLNLTLRRNSNEREKESIQEVSHSPSAPFSGSLKEQNSFGNCTSDIRSMPMEEESFQEVEEMEMNGLEVKRQQISFKTKEQLFLKKCKEIIETVLYEWKELVPPMDSKLLIKKVKLVIASVLVAAGIMSIILCFV